MIIFLPVWAPSIIWGPNIFLRIFLSTNFNFFINPIFIAFRHSLHTRLLFGSLPHNVSVSHYCCRYAWSVYMLNTTCWPSTSTPLFLTSYFLAILPDTPISLRCGSCFPPRLSICVLFQYWSFAVFSRRKSATFY